MLSLRHAALCSLLTLGCVVLPACGDSGTATTGSGAIAIPDSPDGTITTIATAMADHRPRVVWDAMPASYQADVQSVVNTFAQEMDAELYDQGFVVAQKMVNVLKTKKDFILGMEGSPLDMMIPPGEKANLEANWDGIVEVLEGLAHSEISTLEGLKGTSIPEFLDGPASRFMDQIGTLAEANAGGDMDANFMQQLRDTEVEVLETGDGTAKLLVMTGEEFEEMEMTQVEGRWVPTDIASQWETGIEEAKQALATMKDDPQFQQNKMQAMTAMGGLESALDQLANAQTQEEFSQGIGFLMMSVMGGGF